MRVLDSSQPMATFWAELARAPRRVLFLDYDGTLAPFCHDRMRAFPYPWVEALLDKLMEDSRTRLVLVTGRWTEDMQHLIRLKKRPELWGCHGWERVTADGTHTISPLPAAAAAGMEEAGRLVTGTGWGDLNVAPHWERKPVSVALHYRGMRPDQVARLIPVMEPAWEAIAQSSGLHLRRFDGGIELVVPGINKGHAVKVVLEEEGPQAVAAFLGDDLTDEDGFEAMSHSASQMQASRLGVLVREQFRQTRAKVWIKPPGELMDFLNKWQQSTEIRL